MTDGNPLAAELLETSAAGYASAANVLLQRIPQRGAHFSHAAAEWKAHLTQRILELATAVRVNEPVLFARRIGWLRRALRARGADESDLREALMSLGAALAQELPEALKSAVEPPIALALETFDRDIEPEPDALDAATVHGKLGFEYLTTCLEARSFEAQNLILDRIGDGMTPQDAYTKVLLPAQREIGQLWHVGDVTVTEERLVSETTRALMTLIVNRSAPPADDARTVLAASVAGNAHDIGLRAAADLFKLAGWRTIFLGADMPTAEIASAARTFDAKLVVLSATLTTQIGTLATAIKRVRDSAPGARILIGGLALDGSGDLYKQLGADAYAPVVDAAVELGSQLIANG